jgi:hypothetical protein
MLRKTSLHREGERNGEPRREPCVSCTVHLSAPGKASNLPRISIRNGFTRPTGDINVSSPLFTKRPSREENLTENLCDLPFFFRGPATRTVPPALPWRPTRVRRGPSHTANGDRGSLKQSNPLLVRGLEKGKPQSESLVFSRNLRSHERATVRETRIITELGVPVQDAFDALLTMNLGRLPSCGLYCGGFDPCPYFLPYGV